MAFRLLARHSRLFAPSSLWVPNMLRLVATPLPLQVWHVAKFTTSSESTTQKADPPSVNWEEVSDKIKKLVATRRVVLFMKGSPDNPQCGFSAKVVAAMQEANVGTEFTFVNVLEYPIIREGIKKFSEWPTIPQLFVEGEFVGGCDIILDMLKSGELTDLLVKA